MDLAGVFESRPGVTVRAGLPDSWHWALAPGWDFGAALSEDRRSAFQTYARDGSDEGLATAVLAFARAHGDEVTAAFDRPLAVVEGFTHPGSRFDVLVAFRPGVHKYHRDENPAAHARTLAVYPAYRCEFAGDEDEQEAWLRYARAAGVPLTKHDRVPRPYAKLRWVGDDGRVPRRRTFAYLPLVPKTMYRLQGAPSDRFVEFENYRHEAWRVDWDGAFTLTSLDDPAVAPREIALPDLHAFVRDRLYGPDRDAGTDEYPTLDELN